MKYVRVREVLGEECEDEILIDANEIESVTQEGGGALSGIVLKSGQGVTAEMAFDDLVKMLVDLGAIVRTT